jgi:hypothetical protein
MHNYNRQTVLSIKQPYQVTEAIPFVYFLIKQDSIVYVGQSNNLWDRIAVHRIDKKDFDHVSYVEKSKFPGYTLNDIEAYFILSFLPPINKSVPPNNLYWPYAQLCNDFIENKRTITGYSNTGFGIRHILKSNPTKIQTIKFLDKVYINKIQFDRIYRAMWGSK